MAVRRIAAAVIDLALLGQRGLLGEIIGAVQFRDILGDDDAAADKSVAQLEEVMYEATGQAA